MLLFEAKNEIESRLELKNEYAHQETVLSYFEALEIANKCIDAQIRLSNFLNDFEFAIKEDDHISKNLLMDILNELRFDCE